MTTAISGCFFVFFVENWRFSKQYCDYMLILNGFDKSKISPDRSPKNLLHIFLKLNISGLGEMIL
jgi:hypothetical protein